MIKRNDKAITLIALVVTILVILIIAGVALVTLTGDNGIIGNAEKTKFLNQIKAYQEELKLYLGGSAIDVYVNHTAGEVVNVGLEDQPGIETIIKDISDGEKDQIIIQGNVLYYKYTGNKQRAEWCFKAGIPVWGYSSYDAFVEDISNAPITKGEYSATDGVYVNAPDLTGFNTKNTYYVLYDASGNETIGNSLKVGAPTNITDWYDYSSSAKKWANIVTIGGDGDPTNLDNDRAYFVWIPRYVYKLNKTAQEADIKFVNINNQYKDFADSTLNATYSDTEPTYDADGNQTNYCLPDAFKWGTTPISGYWVSKYELKVLN